MYELDDSFFHLTESAVALYCIFLKLHFLYPSAPEFHYGSSINFITSISDELLILFMYCFPDFVVNL